MVDKKVAAGVAALAVVGTVAALALRGVEAAPVEEGAPEGEVSIVITPLGRPEGFSFDDVQGAWGVGSTIKVNGKCTAGYPIPTMKLELYDKGALRKTYDVPSPITLNTVYTLTETMGEADFGNHLVYGRMVLVNPLDPLGWEWTTGTQSFDIGIEPPGEVTLDVTLV